MKMNRSLASLILYLPWAVALGIIFWLISFRFPLNGVTFFRFAFDGKIPWFDAFLPAQRVTSAGPQEGGWIGQRIKAEPVYASARVPGVFDRVTVGLEVKTMRQPILEFGILRDPETSSFDLQPLWSEALSRGWRRVSQAGVRGFVRDGQSDSLLTHADFERLLVWRAAAPSPSLMDHPREKRAYRVELLGPHDFFLVPTDGEIWFRFQLFDGIGLKRFAKIRLEHDGQAIWEHTTSTDRTVTIHERVPPGVYRIHVIVPNERVRIHRIETTARRWVIGPRVFVSTGGIRMWTNARHLVLEPSDGNPVRMDEPETSLVLPSENVRVMADGYFALEKSALFLPQPRRLTDATDLEREKILGILTPYEPPERLFDGWIRMHRTFSLDRIGERLKFVLSAPGLTARQGQVHIRAIELRYERPPLSWGEFWRVSRRELALIRRRLLSKL